MGGAGRVWFVLVGADHLRVLQRTIGQAGLDEIVNSAPEDEGPTAGAWSPHGTLGATSAPEPDGRSAWAADQRARDEDVVVGQAVRLLQRSCRLGLFDALALIGPPRRLATLCGALDASTCRRIAALVRHDPAGLPDVQLLPLLDATSRTLDEPLGRLAEGSAGIGRD